MHPAGPLIGAGVTLFCLWFSLRQRRRHRLLYDMPTSKAQGVFIGLVELKGTAESGEPLTSYLAGMACVHYTWQVQEHWRRTRTESYTDSKGNRKTRTVTETGWDTVASGGEQQDFYVRDDTGEVLVRPDGAKIEPLRVFDQTVSRGEDLYYQKGPGGSVNGSTGTRRFVEESIPLHAMLYAVGTAQERADVVAPEIVKGEEFILSCRGEEAVTRGLALGSWFAWFGGLLAMPAGIYLAYGNQLRPENLPLFCALAAASFGAVWAACWVWMVHDSLVGLRERVRRGWSLIEVELKRRHDLLPGIIATVSGLGRHEAELQRVLAALRAQVEATRPGQPGPEFTGVAGELRAVVERYPELTAQAGFAALHRELVTTEQRIALARGYYNDIATNYATRLERVPDCWVARLRSLTPEPLLTAAEFERAAVPVRLD
ncbi:MAG: hypothetical protein RIQ79_483 [Verrucomicrobiota bacterium]